MGWKVLEVQPTPNPNAVKFVLDGTVSSAPTSFLNAVQAEGHDLGSRLFAVNGVTSVLLLGDFVTVNKSSAARWADITRKVEAVLAEV